MELPWALVANAGRERPMKIDGRCHCGYITYEAEIDPDTTLICNCTDCQTLAGSAFRVNACTREDAFKLLSGELKIYVKTAESGNKRPQSFCPECGTPIHATAAGAGPKVYSIRVGSIRQRDQLVPKLQVWCRSAQPWIGHTKAVRKVEKQPQIDAAGKLTFN
jgi:hypothetical protein